MIAVCKVNNFPHIMLGIWLFPRRGMEFILQTNSTVSYLYTRLHYYSTKQPKTPQTKLSKLFSGLCFVFFFHSSSFFHVLPLEKRSKKVLGKGGCFDNIYKSLYPPSSQ